MFVNTGLNDGISKGYRMSNLNTEEYERFEDIKQIRDDGSEYWSARELASVLEYAKWENFSKVIAKAIIACEVSGFNVLDHFLDIRKMVDIGSGTTRNLKDYGLSRYACYLIVQNGDPRKEVIALGQTYFAIQTRRQEIADRFNMLDEDKKRLILRGDIKQWNQLLAEAARDAGVITSEEFATFQNAGYMGLYGEKPSTIFIPVKKYQSKPRYSTIWVAKNSLPTYFASRRPKANSKRIIYRVRLPLLPHITTLARRSEEQLRKSAEPCPRIC
jgi:hypothetical protein